ncbi:hypothetical protein PENTCL1PPCAC_8984, partial [Pristionchus entomophagus]
SSDTFSSTGYRMRPSTLLICAAVHQISSGCFVSESSTTRREVVDFKPGTTEEECKSLCLADPTCQATLLTDSRQNCVLLGAHIDAPKDSCNEANVAFVKTSSCEESSTTTSNPTTSASTTTAGATTTTTSLLTSSVTVT